MAPRMPIDILPQPDETTCGPTCLHAVYRHYGESLSLDRIIGEIRRLHHGGTLAVFLACHALGRGYRATIYTYNLGMFDPTWFASGPGGPTDIADRLRRQLAVKGRPGSEIAVATAGYLDFLDLGGQLRFTDLTPALIRRWLKRGVPILTGLSATYLYHSAREYGPNSDYDDIRGTPSGHFVILGDYDPGSRSVLVVDPLHPNPMAPGHRYETSIERVLGAILLGVLTHDANLLIIEPAQAADADRHGDIHSRQ